jgi:hypothetical protein
VKHTTHNPPTNKIGCEEIEKAGGRWIQIIYSD